MRNNDPILRAMYIILVPVILLIILLNTGFLQKNLTAATVDGENYTVARYNYYYFDYSNSFKEENADRLAELGFDPEIPEAEQDFSSSMTWEEFFQAGAEAELAETAYYYDLAIKACYPFSEEELAPVEEKLAEHREKQILYNINTKNYYIAYYGSGMTEELYTKELTRQVMAQAYKAYLASVQEHDTAAIHAWMAENGVEDYPAAHLQIITLDALPDRETGEVGTQQLAALESRLTKLVARYEDGVSFASLQQAFSTCTLGDKTGAVVAVDGQVPQELMTWCRAGDCVAGDTVVVIDKETGTAYFAFFEEYSGSGAELQARAALTAAMQEEEVQQIKASYSVNYSTLGMLLAMA